MLRFGIERTCRLVQQKNRGIAEDRPCNATLPFAARQPDTFFAQMRVEAFWQTFDKSRCRCGFGRHADFCVAGFYATVADVLHRTRGEDRGFLRHQPNVTADTNGVGFAEINTVEQDPA